MRLEKIKLAGFKSFVDPTTVQLPSNLVGVVGPNGCGKSNVIDAVRWVMGESSAKMLRGESMADVIFNGSNSRKPVGTATIELVFDNSDGSAGGQYAQYGQIAVKRQVSRDGQSLYFLNGTRCRRRDITDLFLGTGLGPRSYSIIEQGMISRLIEARPEELRLFLEEAAGISKYKERRRETENRIRATRENLDRLNDLRDEVAKQLQHLQRQAATAEKYQRLKAQERTAKAELLALRWRDLDRAGAVLAREIEGRTTAVEETVARQRHLESEIESLRERHHEAGERFNEVQARFYALGAELARYEESLAHRRDARRSQQADLAQVEESWRESEDHRAQDEARLAELNGSLAEEEPRLAQVRTDERAASARLTTAEQGMHGWQERWDRFNQEATGPAQIAQVERSRITQIEQQAEQHERRRQRLSDDLGRLDDSATRAEIVALEGDEKAQLAQVEGQQQALADALRAIDAQRDANRARGRELDAIKERLQAAKGRMASLEALQQTALGQHEKAVTEWLNRRNLAAASRLAQHLEVDPQWQRAVEAVLGYHLQAVCTDDLAAQVAGAGELAAGALTLFDTAGSGDPPARAGDALAMKVRAPWDLGHLLAGVRTIADAAAALAARDALAPGESLVTPDGLWFGRNWLRLPGTKADAVAGVLAREAEIKALRAELARLDEALARLAAEVERGRAALREREQARERAQAEVNAANRRLGEIRAGLSGRRARAEQMAHRREALEHELAEIATQTAQGEQAIAAARQRLHRALEQMAEHATQREALVGERDTLREGLEQVRERARALRAQVHESALKIESMRASRDSVARGLERTRGQLGQLGERRDELTRLLADGATPLEELQRQLEQTLEQRVGVERELADARNRVEGQEMELRDHERTRQHTEQEAIERRSALERLRLQHQEQQVRRQTLEEQLAELDADRERVLAALDDEATEPAWREQVERLAQQIQRLGPINLAAIDEFAEQSERMRYLDAQHEDISRSLETLENAIHKIDRETRTRFKETYDRVNAGLQQMFPRLFGGGHAYLEMTGTDLLDAGVAVMARPPGKRNSSIHLLSGGEKALTAVALVFSIFELNPAPFCMLDEVDAPLDDANVGRFCELVKSMSDRVQFIFITHNKVTMEAANQLCGVTMQEPGVSRLVSVDIEEAAELAAI